MREADLSESFVNLETGDIVSNINEYIVAVHIDTQLTLIYRESEYMILNFITEEIDPISLNCIECVTRFNHKGDILYSWNEGYIGVWQRQE